jgi:hypothetical protein
MADVLTQGSHQAAHVEAAVLVEAAIFGGNHGVEKLLRDALQRDHFATLAG